MHAISPTLIRLILWAGLLWMLMGCSALQRNTLSPTTTLPPPDVVPPVISTLNATLTPIEVREVTPIPTPTPALPTFTPVPFWDDQIGIMNGICFESAYDAREQVFVFGSEAELTNFYNLADNSQLCRQPVERSSYDFSGGRALAGLWSYGTGCTARHDFVAFNRDDTARTIDIVVRFVTEGACNYELIRPFWVGLENATDYQIRIRVEPAA